MVQGVLQLVHTLVGHTNKVYAVECDGRRVISSSMDHMIRVWDLQTGRCLRVLEGALGSATWSGDTFFFGSY
jgi:WD40 repeat protein